MARHTLFVALLLATATVHAISAKPALFETFSQGWEDRWQHSDSDKYGGEFEVDTPDGLDDPALKVPSKAQFYGISGLLSKPIDPTEGVALQYEVKLGSDNFGCGGAYLKFLTADSKFTPKDLKDDSPYTIMFGPDKCGATNKVHLIFRHKNPKTGTIEEKHLKAPPVMAAGTETHVYTAIIKPDNTYAILIDGKESKAGSLFDDFEPPFLPPKEIPDPDDSKPADWVDEAKIPDPDATKPEDWDEDAPRVIPDEDAVKPAGWLDDEPSEVPDASATMPEDWDEEEDGEWEPPVVPNPKCKSAPGCGEWVRPTKANPDYKGKWSAPLIDNPEYKGPWKPRDIPNPEYHEDKQPLQHIGKIGAAAVEIWTMEEGYFFDNIVVANTGEEVAEIREAHWAPKYEAEVAAKAKKAADAKAASTPDTLLHKRIVDGVRGVLAGVPALAPYAAKIEEVLGFFEKTPMAVFAIVGTPLVLVLVLVLRLFSGSGTPDAAAVAKKTDAPTADDAAPATTNGGASTATGEIQADEDEDTGVRRRTRREQ